jgi:hypothetical protein
VLAILLALASAVNHGGSVFAPGLASRRISVIMVSFLATTSSAVSSAAPSGSGRHPAYP